MKWLWTVVLLLFVLASCSPSPTQRPMTTGSATPQKTAAPAEASATDNPAASMISLMPLSHAADYQGWWTYTHPVYNFSIMLPDGWVVNEVSSNDPVMNGHTLILGGQVATGFTESIRMTYRRTGEDDPLWPTGVGPGQFIEQGTLDVAGSPARRVLLVCPSLTNPDGDVTSIWYHGAEQGQPNILTGKIQNMGEMIIASLKAP
jgi:hypothetical protein